MPAESSIEDSPRFRAQRASGMMPRLGKRRSSNRDRESTQGVDIQINVRPGGATTDPGELDEPIGAPGSKFSAWGALLVCLPALIILSVMAYGLVRDIPMGRWLTSPSTIKLVLTLNFVNTWATALPVPYMACFAESLLYAAVVASSTHDWDKQADLNGAIARARAGSTTGVLGLVAACVAVASIALAYHLPKLEEEISSVPIYLVIEAVVAAALTMFLHRTFRTFRVNLVQRERQLAPAYVRSRAPYVLGVLVVQCMLTGYICRQQMYVLPAIPASQVPKDLEKPVAEICQGLGGDYTSAHCVLSMATYWSGEDINYQANSALDPTFVGGAVWVCNDSFPSLLGLTYVSTLAACQAAAIGDSLFGQGVLSGLQFNCITLMILIFRETFAGLNIELSWSSWNSSGGRRWKAALVLAFVMTLFLPYYMLQVLQGPWTTAGNFHHGHSTTALLMVNFVVWNAAYTLLLVEGCYARARYNVDMKLNDGTSLREALIKHVKDHVARLGGGARGSVVSSVESKLMGGDINQLKVGAAEDATLGIKVRMKVPDLNVGAASEGVKFIENEFRDAVEAARKRAAHVRAPEEEDMHSSTCTDEELEIEAKRLGYTSAAKRLEEAEEDLECCNYVLYERAGSSDKEFSNGNLKRDCEPPDKGGGVRRDRLTTDGEGKLLKDFCNHPSAITALLFTAHMFALRLYTTAAFRRLNTPLRDDKSDRPSHPFPVRIARLQKDPLLLARCDSLATHVPSL